MKNKRMLSLLLAAAMIIALVPATAFAAPMENISVTTVERYGNGSLKSFVLDYAVGLSYWGNNCNAANVRVGIQENQFNHPTASDEDGDFTEYGGYAMSHDHTSWDQVTGVVWATNGDIARPATGGTVTPVTVNFEENALTPVAGKTYYVYAWAYYTGGPRSHIYPDAFLFSFTVDGSSNQVVTSTEPTTPTTHTHDWVYTKTDGTNFACLYAACNSSGSVCEYENPGLTVATLHAPSTTYTGSPYAYAGLSADTFNSRTGNSLTVADIKYRLKNDEPTSSANSGAASNGAAPVNAGEYKAVIEFVPAGASVGLVASAAFEITEANTPNVPNNPAPTAPAGKDNWVKYNGGNSFSSNKSAVPTSVEIDGQEVSFVGNGKSFTVGCVPAGAQRITVRWNSTSITTNFKPDAAAYCSEVEIPKTGDLSVLGYAVMAIVAAAGAMGLKK